MTGVTKACARRPIPPVRKFLIDDLCSGVEISQWCLVDTVQRWLTDAGASLVRLDLAYAIKDALREAEADLPRTAKKPPRRRKPLPCSRCGCATRERTSVRSTTWLSRCHTVPIPLARAPPTAMVQSELVNRNSGVGVRSFATIAASPDTRPNSTILYIAHVTRRVLTDRLKSRQRLGPRQENCEVPVKWGCANVA